MIDRGGRIGAVLSASTLEFDVPPGFGAFVTDEKTYVDSVVEIVRVMAKIARSSHDLFARKKKDALGLSLLGCLRTSSLQAIEFNFSTYTLHPLYDLFVRRTADLYLNGVYCEADLGLLNSRVYDMRTEAQSKSFKKRAQHFERRSTKNHASLKEYLRKLQAGDRSLLYLRIDLGYRRLNRAWITRPEAKAHRHAFLGFVRKALPRPALAGFAWKLDHSALRSSHTHFLLIVDSRLRHQAGEIVQELKWCWEEAVTGGRGLFVDCGQFPKAFPGSGLLNGKEPVARRSLRQAVSFMTMSAYYMQMAPRKDRAFGRGGMARTPASDTGVPVLNRIDRTIVRQALFPQSRPLGADWPNV